jgi:hypothetical protein
MTDSVSTIVVDAVEKLLDYVVHNKTPCLAVDSAVQRFEIPLPICAVAQNNEKLFASACSQVFGVCVSCVLNVSDSDCAFQSTGGILELNFDCFSIIVGATITLRDAKRLTSSR